jgi:hypothetical protein
MSSTVSPPGTLSGRGLIRSRSRALAAVYYTVHTNFANGQGIFVELEPPPRAKDGALLHLTLEDGRGLDCQIVDHSGYCAVVGEGPVVERRRQSRELPSDAF